MLAGLLLLCLMAPRYWQSKNSTDATPRPPDTKQTVPKGTVYLPSGWEEYRKYIPRFRGSPPDIDALRLWAAPTIEELIAARTGLHRFEEQSFGWLVIGPLATPLDRERTDTHVATPATPGPLRTATLERVGRLLVDYSPVEALPRLSAKIADLYRLWSSHRIEVSQAQSPAARTLTSEPVSPTPSTLRLLSPEERVAMAPQVKITPTDQEPIPASPHDEPPAPLNSEAWCVPHVLLEQLQRLARHPAAALWAQQTIAQLQALTGRDRLDGDDVRPILEALSDSAQEAVRMADATGDDRLRVELLRAHWGLARRLDCWTAIHDIRLAERSRERVALHGPLGSFFNSPPNHVSDRTHEATLTVDLEVYERSRDPQLGRHVVRQQRALESSPESLDRSLADSVERHYRNANVRIALTAELLNRLVAQEHSEVRALRDRIAGAPVRGRSHTQSGSRVKLDPVEGRWQLTVEASGMVNSNTLVDGGSARLHSQSATDFAARKSVLVDPAGVRVERTVVNANSHNRLVDVTTDFDWVPLLGSFARDRAVAQYRARRERAKAEIEFKVSNEAVAQVDRETLEAVQRVERQVRERLTDRLAEAGVDVTPIEMATMPERVVGRFRVAGDHQLGSHTPRPRALSDSLASVQVHETALTNAAVSLSLDGRRYSGPELQQLFREKFPRLAVDGAAVRRDVVFHFANEDAIECHVSNGRLELTLTLANIEQEGRNMRDIIVHAYYVPVVNGLEAELVRDGSLGIEGRLSSADRARLHNVFNSVLPPERRLPILRLDNPDDPRLEGLMITQLVLEDGWLGLAIGPAYQERVAERSRSLR
jgi:hypothetical protein